MYSGIMKLAASLVAVVEDARSAREAVGKSGGAQLLDELTVNLVQQAAGRRRRVRGADLGRHADGPRLSRKHGLHSAPLGTGAIPRTGTALGRVRAAL